MATVKQIRDDSRADKQKYAIDALGRRNMMKDGKRYIEMSPGSNKFGNFQSRSAAKAEQEAMAKKKTTPTPKAKPTQKSAPRDYGDRMVGGMKGTESTRKESTGGPARYKPSSKQSTGGPARYTPPAKAKVEYSKKEYGKPPVQTNMTAAQAEANKAKNIKEFFKNDRGVLNKILPLMSVFGIRGYNKAGRGVPAPSDKVKPKGKRKFTVENDPWQY